MQLKYFMMNQTLNTLIRTHLLFYWMKTKNFQDQWKKWLIRAMIQRMKKILIVRMRNKLESKNNLKNRVKQNKTMIKNRVIIAKTTIMNGVSSLAEHVIDSWRNLNSIWKRILKYLITLHHLWKKWSEELVTFNHYFFPCIIKL